MSDRRSRKKKRSKAVRGATLYSGKSKKKKKRTRRNSDNKEFKPTIYNRASDPHHEKQLINYLAKNDIEVKQYKDRYILRRLRVRMGRLRFTSYKDYLDYIRKNPTELGEIQESLSINVTRFFRNRDTYETVKKKVLPRLAKNKNSIKIWSAGCAVGAEPYSIAMIASDVVPKSTQLTILATDIKEELLRSARHGIYSKPYLAEMKSSEISRYFTETTDGDYKVKPQIKSTVNFRQQDLMKDSFPNNIDMIFCRNVLIYVDREAQNIILNGFFEALKPGGILVLGRTETLFGNWRKSVDIISTKHRIYQKKVVGQFNPIEMTDPVSDLMGAAIPKLKKRSTKPERSVTTSKKRSKEKISTSERLQELKDFRRTFEKRKKIWEERMEKNRERRRLRNRKKEGRRSSGSFTFSTSSSSFKKTKTTSIDSGESTGSLSDYRKILKKSRSPTREAKVRKDLDKD